MRNVIHLVSSFSFLIIVTTTLPTSADDATIAKQLAAVRAIGLKGQGNVAASAAWRELAKAKPEQLTSVLAGMDGASQLSTNWLRAAVDTIAQRTLTGGDDLPKAELEKFLLDTSHSPRGRRTAYELLLRIDPTIEKKYLPTFMDDPSLDLRYDAVATSLTSADELAKDESNAGEAVKAYEIAFHAARDTKQVKAAAAKIKKLGGEVDLPRHFGFLQTWHVIAPFNNKDKSGFDVAYPPEQQVNLSGTHDGIDKKEIRWKETTSSDDFGIVDLNEVLAKHKGAIGYAYTEFKSADARSVDLRLGCINAHKVWLNGKLIGENNVYHAGMEIDQYVFKGDLKAGKNTILLKVAQNEQEDSWAQRWQFQLRICDEIGTAVLETKRD